MENKSNAGRKKLPENLKQQAIRIFLPKELIEKLGGSKSVSELGKRLIINYKS